MRKNTELEFHKARRQAVHDADIRSLEPKHVANIPGLNRRSRRAIAKAQRKEAK